MADINRHIIDPITLFPCTISIFSSFVCLRSVESEPPDFLPICECLLNKAYFYITGTNLSPVCQRVSYHSH